MPTISITRNCSRTTHTWERNWWNQEEKGLMEEENKKEKQKYLMRVVRDVSGKFEMNTCKPTML